MNVTLRVLTWLLGVMLFSLSAAVLIHFPIERAVEIYFLGFLELMGAGAVIFAIVSR